MATETTRVSPLSLPARWVERKQSPLDKHGALTGQVHASANEASYLGHVARKWRGFVNLCTEEDPLAEPLSNKKKDPSLGRSVGQLMVVLGGTFGAIEDPARRTSA